MSRTVLGICTALEPARWSVWDQPALLLPRNYVDAAQEAGAMVLMIPPDRDFVERPDEVLDRIDALVLAGGADIDPSFYGADREPASTGTVPERDASEIALTRAAIARDMPLLGICRGMQLLNVARGGTLVQDLDPGLAHRRSLGTFEGSDHEVRLAAGSLAARAAGETLHNVKSHHHQAVELVGEGLLVSGRASQDDLVETIELPGARWVLGVQWHPEADTRSRIVAALVEAAAPGPPRRGA